MRLLFDQNISFRVIKGIMDIYPDAKQVMEVNLENPTDLEIWLFAKKEGYTIVTFDSDFYHSVPVSSSRARYNISTGCEPSHQGLWVCRGYLPFGSNSPSPGFCSPASFSAYLTVNHLAAC